MLFEILDITRMISGFYPPASKASREVANLTERKNLPTPIYGVKEFVSLSVYPSV